MQDESKYRNTGDLSSKYHECCILGHKFLKWGLGFFIFGVIFGFGVLIHYLVGSSYNNTNLFLSNITLWFGSPLTLSVGYLQIGGLAMAAIGGAYLAYGRYKESKYGESRYGDPSMRHGEADKVACARHSCLPLYLCAIGLIALFVLGYL